METAERGPAAEKDTAMDTAGKIKKKKKINNILLRSHLPSQAKLSTAAELPVVAADAHSL